MRGYSFEMGVGLKHPLMILADSLMATFTCLTCADASHTCAAYSAAETQSANADVLRTEGFAPHFWLTSFLRMLFLVVSLPFSFLQCSLKDSVRSRVTPRYLGVGQFSRVSPHHTMLSFLLASLLRRWNAHTCVFPGFGFR
uniref:Uncharacterized protein n=1 Tax=Cacopsylla melanoneura TaxID=428564 RepID=A0A8D8V8U4_9HEMI